MLQAGEVYWAGGSVVSEEGHWTQKNLPGLKGKNLVIMSSQYLEYCDNDLMLGGKEL